MDTLMKKAINMVKYEVDRKGIKANEFEATLVNSKYHTDGVELHLLDGKAFVTKNGEEERELTSEETLEMKKLIYADEKISVINNVIAKETVKKVENKRIISIEHKQMKNKPNQNNLEVKTKVENKKQIIEEKIIESKNKLNLELEKTLKCEKLVVADSEIQLSLF